MPSPIQVVAAVRRDGDRYWTVRRRDDGSHGGLAGMWEYPGGKVEQGEALDDALCREMLEEFGVLIRVGRRLATITTELWGKVYAVNFIAADFLSEPELREHDAQAWSTVAELQTQKHLPSGTELNRRLADEESLHG